MCHCPKSQQILNVFCLPIILRESCTCVIAPTKRHIMRQSFVKLFLLAPKLWWLIRYILSQFLTLVVKKIDAGMH